jgi:hypothetical protein
LIRLTDKGTPAALLSCFFISASAGHWPHPLPPEPNPIPPAYVQIEAAYRKVDHSLDQIIQRLAGRTQHNLRKESQRHCVRI